MANIIPVVCVRHANGKTTQLYEVPLCGIVKRGDKIVYKVSEDGDMYIGTCITDANYTDEDVLKMVSEVTHQELPLPRITAKLKIEPMHYYTDEEADI